jgi:hypothetical protein
MDDSGFQGCYTEQQGINSQHFKATYLKTPQPLKMKVVCFFDMMGINNPANQYNKSEDLNLQDVV